MSRDDLEFRKLDSEIEQLGLQNRKLSRELDDKRSFLQRPSAWEILKSIAIFLPLLFASLGYCRSLEQDRREQLDKATKVFLGDTLGAGPHLLDAYAQEYCEQGSCSWSSGCRDKCRQSVARILVSGVQIRNEKRALERSRQAMQTLLALSPDKELSEELCRRVADDVISIHERYVLPANTLLGRGLDDAQQKKAVDEIDSALRDMKPVICAAVETNLCPEARLKARAHVAWENTQSYFANNLKPACGT